MPSIFAVMAVQEFIETMYPGRCSVCGLPLSEREVHLCTDCLRDLPLTYFWNWRENPAEMILWGRTYFEKVSSLFFYSRDNAYSSLVRKLKYSGDLRLGIYLGSLLGHYMRESFREIDLLVPVPVHLFRKWKRGYNQAGIVAEGICRGMERGKVMNALSRSRYAPSQTSVSVASKWNNVQRAFRLRTGMKKALEGRHVLLVDDVLTSGATSEACYDALSAVKDIRISLATLAFVRH